MARLAAHGGATRRRWLRALGICALVLLAAVVIVNWDGVLLVGRYVRASAIGNRFLKAHPTYQRDIAPHPDVASALDVYWSEEHADAPVLIFVHGGSWSLLSKESFTCLAALLVPRGYTVVLPGYTLYPKATYEQMANEVAAAVTWTLEHAGDYQGDPSRVYLSGHSAGAHLAALVATDPRWLEAYGHTSAELAGVIGISGVYDLALMAEYTRSQTGSDELLVGVASGWRNYAAASPVSYARADLPPMLLIHGSEDTTVPPAISRVFGEALQAAGAPSELVIYPGAEHTDFLFRSMWGAETRLLRDLERFMGTSAAKEP